MVIDFDVIISIGFIVNEFKVIISIILMLV